MYCIKCGAQIPDDSKFCTACGAAVEIAEDPRKEKQEKKQKTITFIHRGSTDESQARSKSASDQGNSQFSASQQSDKSASGQENSASSANFQNGIATLAKKQPPLKPTLIVVAVIAVIAVIALLAGSRNVTVNLNKYVTITSSGYNGMGRAEADFDTEAFLEDYGEKIELSDDVDSELTTELLFYTNAAELLIDSGYINSSLDVKSELSNGDTVTLAWDCSDSIIEKYFNVKLKYSDIEYKVKDLEEAETVDIFEGVTVKFSGTAPNAQATIQVSNDLLSENQYQLDKSSGLSEGDVVTVTVSESAAENLAESDGKVPETLSKEFTVSGISYYVTALSDVPDDAMNKMKSQAEDAFNAYRAKYWDTEKRTLTSFEFQGCYFLSAKEYQSWSSNNIIYLVYQVQVNQMGSDLSYYWYIKFTDGIVLEDGTFSMNYSDYDIPNAYSMKLTSADGTELSYGGYSDVDSMFNELVTEKVDKYTYESTVGEATEEATEESTEE